MSDVLSISVVPGYLPGDKEKITPAILRAMARPNILLVGSIGTVLLEDGSVTTQKLADGALSADATGRAKMADGFLTLTKLMDGLFTADTAGRAKFADGFVFSNQLAPGAVTTDKVASQAITPEKLSQTYISLTGFPDAAALQSNVSQIYNYQHYV